MTNASYILTDSEQKMRKHMILRNLKRFYAYISPYISSGFERGGSETPSFRDFVKSNINKEEQVFLDKEYDNFPSFCIFDIYQITRGSLPPISNGLQLQSDENLGSSDFGRVGYVEEYNQTEGTGFNYNVSFWTDIHLGDLVIDENTTTGEFSQAIVENNESFRYGDLIMFIYGDTLLDSSADTKDNRCFTLRVVLDESDTQKLSGYDFDQSQTGYYVSGFSQHEDTLACSIQISSTDELIQNVSDIGGVWIHSRLENGRLLTSPQSFEHYNHQMVAEHSDESYRKHTYESFGYKSYSKLDPIFRETYDEPLRSWHYGDSFYEHSGMPGCNTDQYDTTGLELQNPTFDQTTGYLIVNQGMLTIPNVPKGCYVRVEYKGTLTATSTDEDKFAYVGLRTNENRFRVATYQALKEGTYKLNISSNINIRSIVITPYQYATLKYGNMEYDEDEEEDIFIALKSDNKYVAFNVTRSNSKNTFTKDGKEYDDKSVRNALPVLTLNVDGQHEEKDPSSPIYKKISDYTYSEGKKTYIKYSSTSPHVAFIDNTGKITLTGIAGNTTIIAELISDDNLYNGSEVIDSYEIRVMKEGNTLRLENNEVVTVNEKFEDLNNITLTIGGWQHTDTYNVPGVGPVSDSWTNAQYFADPIIGSNGVLDGFDQFAIGTHVAKSESLGNDDGNFYPKKAFAHNVTPWTLPCRGAYVKFESVKPGIVTMYTKQTGCLTVDSRTYDDIIPQHINWYPVYITDETGRPVENIKPDTRGLVTYNDGFKSGVQFIDDIKRLYNTDNLSFIQELINFKNDNPGKFDILSSNWNEYSTIQDVSPTGDGGYVVISEAIVRYTFNIYPGKTYYIFSNQTPISFCGFNFEEDRMLNQSEEYTTSPVREFNDGTGVIPEVIWNDNDNQPVIPIGSGNDVTKVTYNRNFTQSQWSSICLPFSMNSRQISEQFGEDTVVVLLNGIDNSGQVNLIWHPNQDIIAGYPYFILPRGTVVHENVTNGVITKIEANVYFDERVGDEHPVVSVGSNGESFGWQSTYDSSCYTAEYPYVFEGNFTNTQVPAGSYVMSADGALVKVETASDVKPFRAYLKYQGSDAGNVSLTSTLTDWVLGQSVAFNTIVQLNQILIDTSGSPVIG